MRRSTRVIGVILEVRGGPFTSPASAALAETPKRAAVQTVIANNPILFISHPLYQTTSF